MARLFIAEKPELGEAIAKGLSGAIKEKNRNFIKKGDDIVTWAYGHILELAMPEDYDEKYAKWNLSDLPFNISEFKYKPIEKSKDQLKIILNFLKDKSINEVVHCGDADDEGQILIEEILDYAKNILPVKRLLINDLSEQGVKKELTKIKDNKEFKGLTDRGFARSRADWLVGLTLTRAYTIQARSKGYKGVLNLGRVQTPILSMVVHRDEEHESFKSSEYFSISGKFASSEIEFKANLKVDERIENKELAYNIVKDCLNSSGEIISVKTEPKLEYPPLPFNLLKLQALCAKCYGLKPDEVLTITQNLREKYKAITYNRSDCEYLPETMFNEAPQIIENLKTKFGDSTLQILNETNLKIKSSAFNDKNITAHHGIIPTANENIDLSKMSPGEFQIFTLIVERFAMQFYSPRKYNTTAIEVQIKDNIFIANHSDDVDLGFATHKYIMAGRADEIDKNDEDKEILNNLNAGIQNLKVGSTAICLDIKAEAKKTKPKPYYTMASLLTDLTGVAKYAKDPKIKALLLEKDKGKKGENGGIGTPATRSNHIKGLIDKEFISVSNDKKQIIHATQKGKDLIAIAPEILTSVDMTALWFEKQKEIENGELKLDEFLKEINAQMNNEINILKQKQMNNFQDSNAIICPNCKKGRLIRTQSKKTKGTYYWYCSEYKNGCNKTFWDKNGKPILEEQPKIKCPICQEGFLIRRESQNKKGNYWWGCSEYKNGCKAMFFDKNGKPQFND